MAKTIIVPTDFSKGSEVALNYAVAFAKSMKAKIILLNAFHNVYSADDLPMETIDAAEKSMEKKSQSILQAICARVNKEKQVSCRAVSRRGLAVDVILNVMDELKPDLIVMGTKGASGLKKIIIGSNTVKVISDSKRPVIAVPENSVFKSIKSIVYATDYGVGDMDALKQLSKMAKAFKSVITLIHVSDKEYMPDVDAELMKQYKVMVLRTIKNIPMKFKIIEGKRFDIALQNYIKEKKPSLLAMSTRSRGMMKRIFGSSSTKKMAYQNQIPLLAFHHTL